MDMISTPTHDAALAAESCRQIFAEGGDLVDLWRFGILQTIDYYNSYMTRGGPVSASRVFDREPVTGVSHIDAAFAALADHLASRDGWAVPPWACSASRTIADPWFVAPIAQRPGFFHDEALATSPVEFRRRNIFISINDLVRV